MPEQFLFTKEKGSLFNVKIWMKILMKKSTLCYGNQILDDVKNRVCDLGILYLSHENEVVMRKVIEENHLVFTELFSAKPHVFCKKITHWHRKK